MATKFPTKSQSQTLNLAGHSNALPMLIWVGEMFTSSLRPSSLITRDDIKYASHAIYILFSQFANN